MTPLEPILRQFINEYQTMNWFDSAFIKEGKIHCWTVYEPPLPLKELIIQSSGVPIEFTCVGRVCLE